MFGSQVLEVAIGLAFFFLMFSVISSSVKESIAGFFSMRSKGLETEICNLLKDPEGSGVAQQVFKYPLITDLVKPGTDRIPSYIKSKTFAQALIYTIAPPADGQLQSMTNIRDSVVKMENEPLKKTLLPLLDKVDQDIGQAVLEISQWYDSAMERASGWYKRQAVLIILLIALVPTVFLNLDSIAICNALWQEQALRDYVVAVATEQVRKSELPSAASATQTANQLLEQKLQLPVGWPSEGNLAPQGWITKIFGLLLTVVGVSLGAPFWFDLINKFVNLRSSGERPPPSNG
jgi:hypothetical protein